MRRLRSFNEAGVDAFREYLDSLKDSPSELPPIELLDDKSRTDSIEIRIDIDDQRVFKNKWEFGGYLNEKLSVLASEQIDRNIGMWSWLSLCYFDLVCPLSKKGKRTPGSAYRHILSREYKNYYRHLVRTPWQSFRLHGVNSRAILSGEPDTGGEAAEALLSRQQLVENEGFFEAIDKLYVRPKGDTWECLVGARGSGGGSMRRLGKILRQYDLTYDLTAMNGDQIFALLPREFERFKNK